MVNVNIIAVGKLSEKFLTEGCNEYIKRLGGFCHVKMMEVEETRLPTHAGERLISAALEAEGARILAKAQRTAIVALCIEGELCSSEQLSGRLERMAVEGTNTVSFCLGSSYGLAEAVKCEARWQLSMSPMTFPHQLARLMLCEQLYRAGSILSGGKYHK
ncbi:MAG: 23S rRNA (pseudouridine(1915)-N(3))-methyltransferase RlmH [Oscillospiraceae bacterium]